MAKVYELFPGIEVVDADQYSANSVDKLNWKKYKQFDRSLNGATIPTQTFIDRLAKHYTFSNSICRSWIDSDANEIVYVTMVNSDTAECVRISFADAAEKMNWKRFNLSKDEQNVIPVK